MFNPLGICHCYSSDRDETLMLVLSLLLLLLTLIIITILYKTCTSSYIQYALTRKTRFLSAFCALIFHSLKITD